MFSATRTITRIMVNERHNTTSTRHLTSLAPSMQRELAEINALAVAREVCRDAQEDGEAGLASHRKLWCSISSANVLDGQKRVRRQASNIYTESAGPCEGLAGMLLNDVGDELHAAVQDSDLSGDEYSESESEDSGSEASSDDGVIIISDEDADSTADEEEDEYEPSDTDSDGTTSVASAESARSDEEGDEVSRGCDGDFHAAYRGTIRSLSLTTYTHPTLNFLHRRAVG